MHGSLRWTDQTKWNRSRILQELDTKPNNRPDMIFKFIVSNLLGKWLFCIEVQNRGEDQSLITKHLTQGSSLNTASIPLKMVSFPETHWVGCLSYPPFSNDY